MVVNDGEGVTGVTRMGRGLVTVTDTVEGGTPSSRGLTDPFPVLSSSTTSLQVPLGTGHPGVTHVLLATASTHFIKP